MRRFSADDFSGAAHPAMALTRKGRGTAATAARLGIFCALTLTLAGCENMPDQLSFLQPRDRAAASEPGSAATRLIERDVEAPEVFQVTEAGLWDGRPSLGGVWVAHPDVTDPERVILRNTANGKFVIGALFRREREIPGPRLQVSSDAAAALGMLAGAPVQLNVTALRREQVAEEAPAASEDAPEQADAIPAPGGITEQALDPIASAAGVLDAPDDAVRTAAAAVPAPAAAPVSTPRASSLDKPYIQIGIFSVKANADRTAQQMRNAGMVPTVYEQEANGKAFWRVVVGPAQTAGDRSALLQKIKGVGFSDAYAVTN